MLTPMQDDDTMQHTGRRIGGSRPALGHGSGNTDTVVLSAKGLMQARHGAHANVTYHSNSSGRILAMPISKDAQAFCCQ